VQPDLHIYADVAWVAIGVVWLVSAAATKRTERTQSGLSRWLQLLLGAVGFSLVFRARGITPLERPWLPDSAVIAYSGLALTLAGIVFAAWARLTLGRNWSAVVTIKEGHSIVRSGPYAIVRHPIYSGGLLALLGTAMVGGQLRALIGVLVVFVAWWFKLRIEEQFMAERFGAEYAQYRREVKALIPFVL